MSTDSGAAHREDDLPSVERLLTLSDGVVAIALTLLVLQLRVPSPAHLADANSASDLATQLGKGGDQLTSYLISYYVIATFWLIHHRVFRRVAGQRESLAWWNFAFLFTITIMPFTSDLLGQYSNNPLAVDIFAVNLLLASLATQATQDLGRRKGLLRTGTDARAIRDGALRSAGAAAVIGVSIGVAWVNTDAAKYCWLLLALVPRVIDRWSARHAGPPSGRPAGAEGADGAGGDARPPE